MSIALLELGASALGDLAARSSSGYRDGPNRGPNSLIGPVDAGTVKARCCRSRKAAPAAR